MPLEHRLFASALTLLVTGAAPVAAQIDLRNPYGSSGKGKIYFEDTPHVWKKELVAANEQTPNEASKFIKKVEGGGGTGIKQALELAFGLEPQTVVLITDGEPTDAAPAEILSRVSELNPDKAVTVHAVGVGEDHDKDFMRGIAERNGGEYLTRGAGL